MAYDKAEIENLALKAIKKHKIAKVAYLIPYLPCSTSTFYDLNLEKSEGIKEALYKNRIERKQKLIDKWEESDNPTLSIASFKLLADDDELERLNVERKKPNEENQTIIIEGRIKGLDDVSNDNK